jgi:ABC-type nitrate/sulfonate/bicarbonate transport system substrate-binding protein
VVLAALLAVLGVVALSDDDSPSNSSGQAAPAPSTSFALPTVATTLATTSTEPPTTEPPPTIQKVTVPRLIGLRLARAKDSLADRGLTAKVTYESTAVTLLGRSSPSPVRPALTSCPTLPSPW